MDKKSVAIWKKEWLPFSETFIRDQIDSFAQWTPIKIGYRDLPNSLMNSDFAPYSHSLYDKYLCRLFGVRPHLLRYQELLKTGGVQLIHAHFGSGGVEALPIAKSLDMPLVTTFHGADTTFHGKRIPGIDQIYRRSLRDLFDYSRTIIAASEYLADRLILSGAPAEKVEVLYTGTKVVPRSTFESRRGIVFVGRLLEIKGCSDLILAFSKISQATRDQTPLTIIGDGPDRNRLESLAASLGVRARFLGRVDSVRVSEELSKHSVFCAPSKVSDRGTREGFGMVFVEASMHECAVAAYASGGVTEAVCHGATGLLANEGDIDQLALNLQRLVEDEQTARQMGNEGRARSIKYFDIIKQTAKLEELYLRQ